MDSERKNPPSSAAIATASRRLAMAFEHAMSNPCAGLLDHGSPEQRVQHAQAEYSRLMNSSNLTTFSILPSEIRGHSGQETIRKEGMVALEGDLLRDPNCEEGVRRRFSGEHRAPEGLSVLASFSACVFIPSVVVLKNRCGLNRRP